MPTILSEAASLIDEYLGNPPSDVLDNAGMVRLATEAAAFYQHQWGNTGHLLTGEYIQFDPFSQEFEFTEGTGFERASFAQRLVNENTDRWERVSIVNIDEIDNETDLGKYAMTFFGSPIQIRLSWDPAVVTPSTLRVWHDPLVAEAEDLDADLRLPLKICKYMIAHKGVLLALPRLRIKAPAVFDREVVKMLADVSMGSLAQYEAEFDMSRFDREEEGWSQVEGFDEQFRGGQRRNRRFF